jgi:hypothetical protein
MVFNRLTKNAVYLFHYPFLSGCDRSRQPRNVVAFANLESIVQIQNDLKYLRTAVAEPCVLQVIYMSGKVNPGVDSSFVPIAFEHENRALMQITELIRTGGICTPGEHRQPLQ